ncbi:helix-turn-helix domain-containing protein [Streptomyces candidus]|uniref:Transcriptional regulator with XRE-family HTH domain n=1 Tax=Streptomyces candidus TaxID=67283 RepID=A0A7X0HM21_9ACTN|nr:helix-turn-helix transcriptional regulator [Streptomyces candidus]MBB6440151.1 transcriptional regulator with XRE-family HTH domain [Streptomyces candidus]
MSAVPAPQQPELAEVVDMEGKIGRVAAWIMIGDQLRTWRIQKGLSLKDVAPVIRGSVSKISRLERGETPPKDRDVLDLARHYRASETDRRMMQRMLEQAHDSEWYQHFSDVTPNFLKRLVSLEGSAEEICTYENQVVPGLLQTREYAEALVRATMPQGPAENIQRVVDFRIRRQLILNQTIPTVLALLDRSILDRPRGGARVMRDQMQHLLDAATVNKVNIRIVEFDESTDITPPYPITHLKFGTGGPAELAYVEYINSANYVTEKAELDLHRNILSRLRQAASSRERSLELLREAIGKYDERASR